MAATVNLPYGKTLWAPTQVAAYAAPTTPDAEKAGGEKVPVREGRPHCFRSEAAQRTVRASFPAYGSRLRMTCYVQSGLTTIIPWLWTLA